MSDIGIYTKDPSGTVVEVVKPRIDERVTALEQPFTGATASAAGKAGLVPAPAIADKDKLLKGDGTWTDTVKVNGDRPSGNVDTGGQENPGGLHAQNSSTNIFSSSLADHVFASLITFYDAGGNRWMAIEPFKYSDSYNNGLHGIAISTRNAGNDDYVTLTLRADGMLTWAGKEFVYTSTDQTIGGNKTFTGTITAGTNAFVTRGTTGNELRILGGTTTTDGAGLFLYGGNNSSFNGQFRVRAAKEGTYRDLIGNYNGNLTWYGQTIQTSSDERLKTPLSAVPDDVLDAWGAVGWGQFRFLDAMTEKGADHARLHLGLIAQRVKAVFEERGLDACDYGILCHDEWEDEYDDDTGDRIREAGDLWTVRYTEALAMEAAYQRRRADRAEARIAALEQTMALVMDKLTP